MTRTVLVTDAHRGSSLSIIQSLGRQGWRVIAASSHARALGIRSRYAAAVCVYAAPECNPEAFVDDIEQCVRQHDVSLIIPVTDEAILPLSRRRERFDGLCQIAMPEAHQLEIVTNKFSTLELARRHGVPVPATHRVETASQADALAGDLHYPVVLKPMRSRSFGAGQGIEAFKVTYAHDAADLVRQVQDYEGRCEVLIQEYYPGEGQGVELLLWQGRPICAFQHRRIREVPVTGGASAFRASMPLNTEMYEHSVRMLAELGWSGLAMVEFKVGQAGPKLMEINGRVWGSLPLAVHSGMDFPRHLAECYDAPPVANGGHVNTDYRTGVSSRNLSLDLVWLFSVLRGGKTDAPGTQPRRSQVLPVALGYLNPLIRTDTLSWDDPLPGLIEIPQIVRRLAGKVRS